MLAIGAACGPISSRWPEGAERCCPAAAAHDAGELLLAPDARPAALRPMLAQSPGPLPRLEQNAANCMQGN